MPSQRPFRQVDVFTATPYLGNPVAVVHDGSGLTDDQMRAFAEKGVEQVATGVERFEKATGVTTLNTLAVAAVPAAEAVTKVAARLEAQSGEWVNRIAGSQAHVRVAKVNTEEAQSLGARYNIRSIPTLAIFKNGREDARQAGAMDVAGIVSWARANA